MSKATGSVPSEQQSVKPQRIQLSRKKGWRMPPNTVKVDRTNRTWGNPFKIGGYFMIGDPDGNRGVFTMAWCQRCIWEPKDIDDALATGFTLIETAETAVAFYRRLAAKNYFSARIEELRGKNLACWCKPGAPCHADVLLELANAQPAKNTEGAE